jgi:hypothetical protein
MGAEFAYEVWGERERDRDNQGEALRSLLN